MAARPGTGRGGLTGLAGAFRLSGTDVVRGSGVLGGRQTVSKSGVAAPAGGIARSDVAKASTIGTVTRLQWCRRESCMPVCGIAHPPLNWTPLIRMITGSSA
ncbi:hypothetical protein [Streptomyces sp. LN245]|uniref:hypothetical protein n=1 Tax=Streptomyces sp. LN245 TaxID=3112975 RepID=UPI00371D581A